MVVLMLVEVLLRLVMLISGGRQLCRQFQELSTICMILKMILVRLVPGVCIRVVIVIRILATPYVVY